MCGIAGILSTQPNVVQANTLTAMQQSMLHRGSHGTGIYMNDAATIGLAHNRLAIIDLSIQGTQPMQYAGRYTIVHNGELYNYKALKHTLTQLGYTFTTATDTEVILAAYMHYGAACVTYMDGMYAFAIHDNNEHTLYIARDRFGEKPLYYYNHNNTLYFASELKALWAAGVPRLVHQSMQCLYLGLGYTQVPLDAQATYYQQVYMLPAAHYLVATVTPQASTITAYTEQYWDIDKEGQNQTITELQATEQLKELLINSIKLRLQSDVPVGTSLSGGLDSSTIAALMHTIAPNAYHTFTAGFAGYAHNETEYSTQVANHLQLPNTIITPTAQDWQHDYYKLIATQEQPFASASVYAQYKVYQAAKAQGITVLLDGQGADETMAGYSKYMHWYLQELLLYNKKLYQETVQQLPKHLQLGIANKLATYFPAAAAHQLERRAIQQLKWKQHLHQDYVQAHYTRLLIHKPLVKKLNDILYHNTAQHGLPELLLYADKNAMAHGVEVRLPYLQHELVQYIYSLPSHFKIKNIYQKHILRKVAEPLLPHDVVWRKDKIGFEVPQQAWLQAPFFVQKIRAAKELLVAQKILNASVLKASTTHVQDFRIMIAAEYL